MFFLRPIIKPDKLWFTRQVAKYILQHGTIYDNSCGMENLEQFDYA